MPACTLPYALWCVVNKYCDFLNLFIAKYASTGEQELATAPAAFVERDKSAPNSWCFNYANNIKEIIEQCGTWLNAPLCVILPHRPEKFLAPLHKTSTLSHSEVHKGPQKYGKNYFVTEKHRGV